LSGSTNCLKDLCGAYTRKTSCLSTRVKTAILNVVDMLWAAADRGDSECIT